MAKSRSTRQTYVVGWYKNATVYRWPQELPLESRKIHNDKWHYVCKTHETDAHCIPSSQRTFIIPTAKDGGYGQSTIWYAKKRKDIQDKVLQYIQSGNIPYPVPKHPQRNSANHDLKKRVETAAMDATRRFYESIGFQVDDVSMENCGWDLTVYNAVEEFYIEVKGTSSSDVNFQVTPNEYAKLKEHWNKYKISNVLDCLGDLNLNIYSISHDKESNKFFGINDKGETLVFTEKTQTYALGTVLSDIFRK